MTWASSLAWELAPGVPTWSKVSPPGGVNAGHSSPAALAIALSSLSARLSATPYFCNGPVDKSASSECAIQQLSTSLWQIWNNHPTKQCGFLLFTVLYLL